MGIRTQVYGAGASCAAEVPEVIADEDTRSLVLRRRSEILEDMVVVTVRVIARVPAEAEPAVVAADVDPIATMLVGRLLVVVTVVLDTRYASDVDQAVVGIEAVRGKAEEDIAGMGCRANPRLADRE
jgi:hypothetical protein